MPVRPAFELTVHTTRAPRLDSTYGGHSERLAFALAMLALHGEAVETPDDDPFTRAARTFVGAAEAFRQRMKDQRPR